MKMFFYQLIFCSVLIHLSSFVLADDSALKREGNIECNVMESTQQHFDEFKSHLEWYFSYLDESAQKEQKNEYGRHLQKNKESLKNAIKESNEIFLKIHAKFRDIALAKYGNYPDTKSEVIAIDAEVTGWYTTYLEVILFPEDWESDFNQYLDCKKEKVTR